MQRQTDNNRVPPNALAVILVIAISEFNFLRTARPLAQVAGQDAWLSVVISFVGTGLSVWLIYAVMRRFPDQTLVEIAQTVFGRPLGIVLVVFYLALWLGRSGLLLQLQSHLFARHLLTNTPEVVLGLYMLLLSGYLVRHGLEPMARLFLIIFAAYLFPLALIMLLGIDGIELGRLKPFLGSGMTPVLHGAWISYAAIPGVEILLMVTPLLSRLRGALRPALTGVAFVMVPAVLLTILLVTRFGAPGVAKLVWPTLSLVEIIEVPAFTGFRLDPIFLVIWSLLIFGTLSFNQFAATSALRRLFRFEADEWPVRITTAILLVFLFVPANPLELMEVRERAALFLTPIADILFPGLLFVAALVRAAVRSHSGGSTTT